jgi:pimeloyl-ACP methyl ester carboxylesterase
VVAPGLHIVEHRPDVEGAPLVILVHGSLDRAASFARVARRLVDLDVVAYDRRGYHRSRAVAPPAVGLDDHVADLLAVLGERRGALVGHSLGGDVAMAAALAAPALVSAVGAYEPPLPWMEWWPRRARTAPDEDPAAFAEAFFRRVVGDQAWDRLPERTRAARRAEGPTLIAELMALRVDEAPFDIDALRVPIVLGCGEQSLWHHRRAVDAIVEIHPDAEVVDIGGASHGAHRSHPDAFADFVRRVVAAGTAPGD